MRSFADAICYWHIAAYTAECGRDGATSCWCFALHDAGANSFFFVLSVVLFGTGFDEPKSTPTFDCVRFCRLLSLLYFNFLYFVLLFYFPVTRV